MKHLTEFDNSLNVGDYVLMRARNKTDEFSIFINNNIGKISSITYKYQEIDVVYDNIPKKLKDHFYNYSARTFDIDQIVFSSHDKDDVLLFLQSRNYNL